MAGTRPKRERKFRPELSTARLLLRSPRRSDRVALVHLMNDRLIAKNTLSVPTPYRLSDADAWISRHQRGSRDPRSLSLLITRKSDGAVLGGISLRHDKSPFLRAELGYWLGREHRRQGYMSEAVEAVCRWGFAKAHLHRIEAAVFPHNPASMSLLRKAGFLKEGRLREAVRKNGTWHDDVLFGLVHPRPRPPSQR
ncbi:MAG: GNAT family N-acetyltransferase [Thermoplasmata archaeon]